MQCSIDSVQYSIESVQYSSDPDRCAKNIFVTNGVPYAGNAWSNQGLDIHDAGNYNDNKNNNNNNNIVSYYAGIKRDYNAQV